jgi:Fe-S cluster assembly protein SufD
MNLSPAIAERRIDAATRFAAEGVPHRRIEAWHYTDLKSVLPASLPRAAAWQGAIVREGALTDPFAGAEADVMVFANGHFRADLSRLPDAPAVQIVDLSSAVPDWAAAHLGAHTGADLTPMADLALAEMTGGVAIRVSRNFKVPRAIHLAFVNRAGQAEARQVRIVLVLETHSELNLLESHAGHGAASLTNIAFDIELGANSRLTHQTIANDNADDIHIATALLTQRANAHYDAALVSAGAALTRREIHAKLAERMARIRLTGFELLGARQHCDMTAVVDHAVRETQSDLVFRNVLAGRSRGVAQGRIIVRQSADGTDSRQSTKALLLSRTAEADAKPELEIHADDVICAHGAAIGDLDADALFYLRARGIPEAEARAMLTEAFLEETLARLPEGLAAKAFRDFVFSRLRTLEGA